MPEQRSTRPAPEPARRPASRSTETGGDDAGQQDVRDRLNQIQEQGYQGTVPDDTPNEAYALPNAGDGTPETDRVHPDKQRTK